MKRSFAIVGIVLLLVAGFFLIADFKTYKRPTWADLFPNQQAIIYTDRQPKFVYITLDADKGNTLKAAVTPKESDDAVLLLLMSPSAFRKFQQDSVTKSDVIQWQEPTSLGQKVAFEFTIPESGTYVVVFLTWKDNNRNGVPFNLELELSTPLKLTLPGVGLGVLGLAVLAFGVIKKPKQIQPTTSPSSAAQRVEKKCTACGVTLPPDSEYCQECGAKQVERV